MAKIVVCSDVFTTVQDFAKANDYICNMMESVVLVPHYSVDSAIADYWSPKSAIEELLVDEDCEEHEACIDDWHRQYEAYIYEIKGRRVPLVWDYDLASFVAANDIVGLCNFLKEKGVWIVQSA